MSSNMVDLLHDFACALTAKFKALTAGEPEDQLKAPVEALLHGYAEAHGNTPCVVKGEAAIKGIGRPDMAVEVKQQLLGHIELKAPGKGADAPSFRKRDHDGRQWERFTNLPNLVYTDGESWALYRLGQRQGSIVRLSGDPSQSGAKAIGPEDATRVLALLMDFFSWTPQSIVPKRPRQLAPFLAPYARLLRDAVADALALNGEIRAIRDNLKMLLFPEATDAQFADAYAQTILFGFLLARAAGADMTNLAEVYAAVGNEETLLDDILEGLTNPDARRELGPALDVAQRMVAAVEPEILVAKPDEADPWLFFYEDFLAAYDPRLRKEAGAYYTPVQVVRCQVRLIDEALRREIGRPDGLLDHGVSILDPAVGTGTYPLAVIDHVAAAAAKMGPGAVGQAVGSLAQRLFGFEIMVGPYAVSQLRLAQSLRTYGAGLPPGGMPVYLTNTLEDPQAPPPKFPVWGISRQISREHDRALLVKDKGRILVVLGNPPYGRHGKATPENHAVAGGWVRWGRGGTGGRSLLADFTEPARRAGHGKHLKNLYNTYVYFIRWAIWKAFEQNLTRKGFGSEAQRGAGIVSFITASSYLDGDAFSGLREHIRRECDEIRILDLGGEGRGTHQDDNVFDIQTPVAIFIAWRGRAPDRKTEAQVRYARIEGSRAEKFSRLDNIQSMADVDWEDAPAGWQSPFRPAANGAFATWPLLTDLMPWQNNGVKAGRTWVIAPATPPLDRRLAALLTASEARARELFKDSPTGCRYGDTPAQLPPVRERLCSLGHVESPTDIRTLRIAYRSFDRQYLLADARLLDRPAPPLWAAHSERQIYLSTLSATPLGPGPALTVAAHIPDLHFCRGSYGAADQLPLYRDCECECPNVLRGLLDLLGSIYGRSPSPEDFASYLYAVLAHPAYQERHADALLGKKVRVPLTKERPLFQRATRIGRRLLWLHTYGERFSDEFGELPEGTAKCLQAPTGQGENYPNTYAYDAENREIIIGEGKLAGRFGPVAPGVWNFEVSGLMVVQSWLGYRMKNRKGKKSSPLDDIGPTEWPWEFTMELLQLLAVLEHTLAGYPAQAELLEEIEAGPLLLAAELPPVPKGARKPLSTTPMFEPEE